MSKIISVFFLVSPLVQTDAYLHEAEEILLSFIKTNPEAWCPIISTVSILNLLPATRNISLRVPRKSITNT